MIHHKGTREDRHKNTPNALAIYVRVRVLPTGDPGKQQLVRPACPCAGPPGVPLCWTQNTCSRYRFTPICCDVPVLWTKNCGTGTWWFALFCSDLAVWYVLIRVLSVRLAFASVCFRRSRVLGRNTTQWAVRRHLSAGAWKTKTQKLRHLSCARALVDFLLQKGYRHWQPHDTATCPSMNLPSTAEVLCRLIRDVFRFLKNNKHCIW